MLFRLYFLTSLSCVIKFIFQMRLVNVSSRSLEVYKFFLPHLHLSEWNFLKISRAAVRNI